MRLMDENYQTKYIKWFMGQSVGYTGVPMSQEEAEKRVLKEMPDPYYNPNHNVSKREIYNKLGQLVDIEEKLEMPIDKFFQALFGSAKMLKVWCIHPHKGLQEVFLSGFENHETARYFNAFNIDIGSTTLGLSEYGKTWAFTREELENERI